MHRLVTIPSMFLAALVALASAPLWLPVAFLVDRVRGGRSAWLRAGLFALLYPSAECVALLAIAAVKLASLLDGSPGKARTRARLFAIQRIWPRTVLDLGMRLYNLRVEVEGEDAAREGPLLVLANHNSMADTGLASWVLAGRCGLDLRYVAKEELRWDPCLDLLGTDLSTVFVRRGSADAAREAERIGEMIEALPPTEAIFLYPEGTRSTPAKRARIQEKLAAEGDTVRLEYARGLGRLLPPRLGGTMALLERNPGVDVLLFRHLGFERTHTWTDLTDGGLVGRTLRVSMVRHPHTTLPRGRDELEKWLLARWAEADAWVVEHLEEA